MNNYYSKYFEECPTLDIIPSDLTDSEREMAEKIENAKDSDEVATIISENLVRSLMEQLEY